MKVEFTEHGLNINGLDMPISVETGARIYHDLFMIYMTAYGREIRFQEHKQKLIAEAEDIIQKGE